MMRAKSCLPCTPSPSDINVRYRTAFGHLPVRSIEDARCRASDVRRAGNVVRSLSHNRPLSLSSEQSPGFKISRPAPRVKEIGK